MKTGHHYTNGIILFLMILGLNCQVVEQSKTSPPSRGNVIFIHPDGSGIAAWAALRALDKGPDGLLNWDKMKNMGIYRGHLTNSMSSSSNGAATVHAYGVKVPYHSYGTYEDQPLRSLSGLDTGQSSPSPERRGTRPSCKATMSSRSSRLTLL